MKFIKLLLLPAALIVLTYCKPKTDCSQILEDIEVNLEYGNISVVAGLADSLKKYCAENPEAIQISDSLVHIAERIGLDFSVTEDQVMVQLEKKVGSFTADDKAAWEKKGWLEWRLIDGEKRYFNRAASNLLLLKKFYEQKEVRLKEIANDPGMVFRLKHTGEIFRTSDNQGKPSVPVNMKITFTLTVHPDVIPEGETIRCWLPWPKINHARQQNIKLLSTSNQDYLIAPDSVIHSTIYMEEKSKKGTPSVFRVSYSYQSKAQYFNTGGLKILPYIKASDLYNQFTSERLPNICFTENIKHLADSITGPDDNPVVIVRKIYLWFKENIPWTGALEYSIMPNIPEYVYKNRRGDCGMQTFLLMSMLRYKGIPVRWQSGWMVPPGEENLHDWCEVYYEGTDWVPVDVSYDLQNSENDEIKEFYLSGIDSYRLIVNDGVAGPFHPAKKYLRSDPYDFQRGEVEWKGGNLYFNKWDYDMKIEYLK
ncbi:MAG: transglutaminase domain-containing protein [Bacteroidetes bacterium]|nr:MAG: transglutaminase domain-containing protein [Bacteroidota bacterium]